MTGLAEILSVGPETAELLKKIEDLVNKARLAGVQEERERCAKIAENWAAESGGLVTHSEAEREIAETQNYVASIIAKRIRSGK